MSDDKSREVVLASVAPLKPVRARGGFTAFLSRMLNVTLLVILAFVAGVLAEKNCSFIQKYTGGTTPAACTCSCQCGK